MPNISVQLRRGTTTEHNAFTGAEGEVTVDTDLDTLRVHDGSTAGGVRLAKHSELAGAAGNTDLGNTPSSTSVEITSSTGNNTTVSGASTSLAGVMTSADKTKLNGIATGATANSSDATLLARANHTGTQTAATISDFDTEVANNSAVTANTAKVSNATHTGDVTGSTALTIADNAVTSSKISDTDTQFLVDDTSTQKKVVVNDGLSDIDFIVKSTGNGNLIITDGANNAVGIGTTANAAFALTSSNAAVGNSLVLYEATSQTEGGQILINKAAINTPSASETDSYTFDTYKDSTNTYQHGTNTDVLRIVTPGAARNATAFADNGDISITGAVFPTGDAQYDLGKSTLKWGTIYASGLNINGNTSFVSKWDSGWVNQDDQTVPVSVANAATLIFDHDLGTDVFMPIVQIWMATDSSGSGIKAVPFEAVRGGGSSTDIIEYGAQVTGLSSSQITIQLSQNAWANFDSSGVITGSSWGTTYTHIRVVAIA
jgi:hypothetical protein